MQEISIFVYMNSNRTLSVKVPSIQMTVDFTTVIDFYTVKHIDQQNKKVYKQIKRTISDSFTSNIYFTFCIS